MNSKSNIPNFTRKAKWLKPLRESRKAVSLTLEAAASELGMSCSALSRLESGERSLEISLLERMCSLYGILPWALLYGNREEGHFPMPSFSPHSRLRSIRKKHHVTLISLARSLRLAQSSLSLIENGKRRLIAKLLVRILDSFGEPYEGFYSLSEGTTLVEKNILGSAAAGKTGVAEAWGSPTGIDTAFAPAGAGRNTIALEIDGDSMYPYYRQGDVVLCSPELYPRTGDICVFRFTDSSMVCKKYIASKGEVILRSINPEWEDLKISQEEIEAIWPVIGSYRREKGRKL